MDLISVKTETFPDVDERKLLGWLSTMGKTSQSIRFQDIRVKNHISVFDWELHGQAPIWSSRDNLCAPSSLIPIFIKKN